MPGRSTLKVLQFLAVMLVALALVPAGAHFFELPNKIALPPDQYMVIQQIYRGWALFGFVVIPALALTLLSAIAVRDQRLPALLAFGAFLCVAATQAIFWSYTYPANAATSNWTVTPGNLASLRTQWEYSHAVNAVLTFAALALIVLSALNTRYGDSHARA